MDIEFHYYMTYLIAARAGYAPTDATTIAHSAQSVDDNHIPVRVIGADGEHYENAISQTMDIMRPHEDSLIYPIFHFIPGDPHAESAKRADGRVHTMVTTPNSKLANEMIDAAVRSGDLYRIGVSAHGYVDTWAHQNFVGKRDTFNEFATTMWEKVIEKIMAVGHAHAKHFPDMPGLVWEDTRLAKSRVDNRERFLDAAEALFAKLAVKKNPGLSQVQLAQATAQLRRDLDGAIGPQDDTNAQQGQRMERYCALATQQDYGGHAIPLYDADVWFETAIASDRGDVIGNMKKKLTGAVADIADFFGDYVADAHREEVAWKDGASGAHKETHWFKFQEAVKSHLSECTDLLRAYGQLA